MFVNKYVQDRRERAKAKEAQKNEEVKNPSPQKPRLGEVYPMPRWAGRPPLQGIEKKNGVTQSPLPGGGWWDLSYEGPLKEKELEAVEKNYPIYKEAERRTGVNWKIIAAVHYRESDFGLNKKAKGNEFQFDGVYKKLASGDLLKDAVSAGKILQEKIQIEGWVKKTKVFLDRMDRLTPHQTDGENVRQALFRYNGTIYKTPENSPYVMNQLDEGHQGMSNKYVKPGSARVTDPQMGALLVIRELGKVFVD